VLWAVAFQALMPRPGVTRAAHLLYGAVMGITTAELAEQRRPGAIPEVQRHLFRVG
jgi:hypothetical protein